MRLLLLALFLPGFLLAQTPPAGIYNTDLRDWLKLNWYDGEFTDLGYSVAREQMYGFTDEMGGMIQCIYTGFEQASSFTTFPDPINAEHLIPQSFYGSATPMRSDIHNLRPSHQSPNSARGNSPFGEVNDADAVWYGIDGSGNYFSTSTQPVNFEDFSERFNSVWEPRDNRKGDVARQVFYFYTMYPTQAGDISGVGVPAVFYQWHLDDPVSADEITRNDRIEMVQGNRNPYVDMPGLVYDAWFWVEALGCTDVAACNYDAAANSDDGSCFFIGDACDDGDPATTGEVIDATCTCTVSDILGCTDGFACNYNPAATVNDGSCEFQSCAGCTNSTACNFNPAATLEDGTCAFEGDPCDDGDAGTTGEVYTAACDCAVPVVVGCMYPDALNYNPLATVDDLSCVFNCSTDPCTPGDLNGDGETNTSDLLAVIADFGNSCE